MNIGNFHTHTYYCDGTNEPDTYAEEAVKLKLPSLGFSSHAPVSFPCAWTIPFEKYKHYIEAVSQVKAFYTNQLEIYCGLEIDYIPDLWSETNRLINLRDVDYFIGSIHFIDAYKDGIRWGIDGSNEEFRNGLSEIFNNDLQAVIHTYFDYTRKMVQEMKPSVIGHIDKIKMQHTDHGSMTDDPAFKNELYLTLEEIASSGCIVEINTRGVYRRQEPEFYPGTWAIREMSRLNIPVILSSDAHRPEELINLFSMAVDTLRLAGYKSVITRKLNKWIELDINEIY